MPKSLLLLAVFLVSAASFCVANDGQWPLPPKRYTSRPQADPLCGYQTGNFCQNGYQPQIRLDDQDQVRLFYYDVPVMRRALGGDYFAYIHSYHSLLAFESRHLARNITVEMYAFGGPIGTAYPRIQPEHDQSEQIWCQQAGSCVHPDLDWNYTRKTEGGPDSFDGYIVELARDMTGAQFNLFMEWTRMDNDSLPLYNGFNLQQPGENATVWIESLDCADFVQRALIQLHSLGVPFIQSSIKISRMQMYSQDAPQLLGTWAQVKQNATLVTQLNDYFQLGLPDQTRLQRFLRLMQLLYRLLLSRDSTTFVFYNDLYWKASLVHPRLRIVYIDWPLPAQVTNSRDFDQ